MNDCQVLLHYESLKHIMMPTLIIPEERARLGSGLVQEKKSIWEEQECEKCIRCGQLYGGGQKSFSLYSGCKKKAHRVKSEEVTSEE